MNDTNDIPSFTFTLIVSLVVIILTISGLICYGIVCTIFIIHRNTDFRNPFYQLALALAFCDCTYLFFTTYIITLPIILSPNRSPVYSNSAYAVFYDIT